ncbi:PKD-like family lipoprotein [Pedobacter miscanthi]|uniref:PKD-like family protein n=1 Tax=Pedobacter miscanthi TaxID=2259170 RepID=A0A366L1Y8_9SPHI|nr:PKD-like family lipoprotein [Pedobacter miscanthi]RBQ07898.1 hypothetical protein DRW42_09870 [Pedobacter miscanthi]
MKKLYMLVLGLLLLFSYSCVKNKGNDFKPDLPLPVIKGYETSYKVFTYRDILKISPTVENEEQYSYYWTVFSGNFNVQSGTVPKGDTISRTKNLDYNVQLNPGQYTLVFNLKNKQTSVTQLITSSLTVSTLTMTGWYLLKDDGAETDFDFIYSGGRIDNWISNFNGSSLKGKAIKSIFAGSFKKGLTSSDLYSVLAVVSDQDAAIFRIDNGKKVMGFEDMFFTKPTVKKPQNIFQPTATNLLHIINDGKIYAMNKGSLFANLPASSYLLSPIGAVGACTIAFDENSKSVITIDNTDYKTLANSGPAIGTALKNMNAEPIWMAGYAGFRSIALVLFRKANGDGYLARLNATYNPLAGSTSTSTPALIQDSKPVPVTHGLMNADVIGGNHDSDYIYYAKGNKVYMTDVASLPENLQLTLPDGENVTSIQHIKYPQPAANVTYSVDCLAIATYKNGDYKVYLHKISSIGTIQALSQANFTGHGRVNCVNYIENGNGNRTY